MNAVVSGKQGRKQLIEGRLIPKQTAMWGVCDIGQRKREEGSASRKGNVSAGTKKERYFGANVSAHAPLAVDCSLSPRALARFVACVLTAEAYIEGPADFCG